LRTLSAFRKVNGVVPLVRLLLAIIVALAVASSSAVSFASAGVVGDSECCCPIKAKCKCHDHEPDRPPTLKRCNGDGKLVLPVIATAIEVAAPELTDAPRTLCPPTLRPVPIPEDRAIEIVTPPS
jgi:hypothetical protein